MFKLGDEVKWNDPAIGDVDPSERDEYMNTVYTICGFRGDIIELTTDGICVTEVYEHEIYKYHPID